MEMETMTDATKFARVLSRALEIAAAEMASDAPAPQEAPQKAAASKEAAKEAAQKAPKGAAPVADPDALRKEAVAALVAHSQAHGRPATLEALQSVVPGATKIHDVPDEKLAALIEALGTPAKAAA